MTDSENLCSFFKKGSTRAVIQRDFLAVFRLTCEFGVQILPIHLQREEANSGTRKFDPDDWGVDPESFQNLTSSFEISIDLFAHLSNKKTPRFYSFGAAYLSSGVDAFAFDRTDENAWVCPPICLVIPAFRKILRTRMTAILVVPRWRSAAFWPVLFPDGKKPHSVCWKIEVFRPHIVLR